MNNSRQCQQRAIESTEYNIADRFNLPCGPRKIHGTPQKKSAPEQKPGALLSPEWNLVEMHRLTNFVRWKVKRAIMDGVRRAMECTKKAVEPFTKSAWFIGVVNREKDQIIFPGFKIP